MPDLVEPLTPTEAREIPLITDSSVYITMADNAGGFFKFLYGVRACSGEGADNLYGGFAQILSIIAASNPDQEGYLSREEIHEIVDKTFDEVPTMVRDALAGMKKARALKAMLNDMGGGSLGANQIGSLVAMLTEALGVKPEPLPFGHKEGDGFMFKMSGMDDLSPEDIKDRISGVMTALGAEPEKKSDEPPLESAP